MAITKQRCSDVIASTLEQKDQLPVGSKTASVFLSTYFHAGIAPLIKKLEEMRDANDCSITFKDFTQIIAEKSASKPQTPQLIFRLV